MWESSTLLFFPLFGHIPSTVVQMARPKRHQSPVTPYLSNAEKERLKPFSAWYNGVSTSSPHTSRSFSHPDPKIKRSEQYYSARHISESPVSHEILSHRVSPHNWTAFSLTCSTCRYRTLCAATPTLNMNMETQKAPPPLNPRLR